MLHYLATKQELPRDCIVSMGHQTQRETKRVYVNTIFWTSYDIQLEKNNNQILGNFDCCNLVIVLL
jgi:hypothetical protein